MKLVSLEELQEREHNALDNDHDDMVGLSFGTRADKFMEINHARMGEDSEKTALREKRSRKLLSQGSLPSYNPY